MKFSSTLSSSMQRCLLPPILKSMASFSAAPFFWRIAQPSGEDQQNGKQTYCQLPSLSFRITFKDTCFQISVDSYGFYLSSEYLRIFSQTCIAHHGWRKFMVFRLLEYVFVRQKIESNHFCSCPQAKFSPQVLNIIHQGGRNYPFPQGNVFMKIYFPPAEKGQKEEETLIELKKGPLLNLPRYWWQVLINPTIFASFTFLVNVLLYHNSSMIKCEGSFT